ncbi:MAG: hypothetical protein J4431_01550 [Candidatus Aenigmarchaeota archaeon]|nr:hypothetical protein [Candidatus Aenigmarchaeota archaeon]
MLKTGAFLLLVILAAGCTGLGPDFGSSEIKVSKPVTEGSSNIAVIRDINTIPTSPVLPSDQVDVSFIVENTDSQESLKGMTVELYDAASFYNGDTAPAQKGHYGKLCNIHDVLCLPEGSSCSAEKCELSNLAPGGQKLINYKLLAPSESSILGLSTDMELRFAVEHDFTAKTTYRPVVVNADEIKALQRAGQQVSIEAPTSIGSGPVKLDVSLKNRDFILNKNRATFEVRARHTGSGRLSGNVIEAGKLEVKFIGFSCDEFEEPVGIAFKAAPEGNDCKFTNTENAEFFRQGLSVPMLFIMKGVDIGTVPQRSYEVAATADYTYRLTGVVPITVKPAEI